jgi:ketosteroid isomerase-like protein
MSGPSNEEIVRAYLDALIADDGEAMARLRDPAWTVEYPQSGERIRGHANDRLIAANYPGGLPDIDPRRVIGSEDTWVVTPSFTFERIAGSGDTWWVEGRARYPGGSTWYLASLYELRGGRIRREVTYWAEPFDPPAWRAAWVEPLGEP